MDTLKRIATFASNTPPRASALALAGYVYDENTNNIRCVKCGHVPNDTTVHDPSCTPDHQQPRPLNLPDSALTDTVKSILNRSSKTQQTTVPKTTYIDNMDIWMTTAAHPSMANPHCRLETFRGKDHLYRFPIQSCVDAGLYYQGTDDDSVRCFFCDGGLKRFQPNDDPWTEHCKWFPDCIFVKHRDEFAKYNFPLRFIRNPKYVLTRLEMASRMQSPMIRVLIDKGYSINELKNVLERRFAIAGDDYKTVAHLVADVFVLRDTPLEMTIFRLMDDVRKKRITDPEVLKLADEYDALDTIVTCKICADNKINIVFLPCGHFVSCNVCAPQVTHCCICRSLIRGTVTVQP